MPNQQLPTIQKLLEIMKILRDPINGCEWDQVQTFDSIKKCTLEETYEVFDAIDKKDYQALKNELGDLLFQIVFYAQMAQELSLFDFDDVCQSISDKLIQRHPHLFSKHSGDKINWEQIKQRERDEKQQYSILDDIADAMPALMRAEKIQKRCASVGFDWDSIAPVFDKVKEEVNEVAQEIEQTELNSSKVEEEIGDLLFATVNLSRHCGFNTELMLQKANKKFERRFRQVEDYLTERGKVLSSCSLDEMEEVWQLVKQQENR